MDPGPSTSAMEPRELSAARRAVNEIVTAGIRMNPGPSTSTMEPREEFANSKEAVKDCIIAGLQEMYFSETMCDVAIVTAEKRFLAHRVVLASVSPYFTALFTCPMKESVLGEVRLLDIPSSVMTTILHYIYTGEAYLTLDNVEELYTMSSRLQVTAMIDMCSSYLARRIDDENCFWVYRLAYSHNHTSLLNAAISHIGRDLSSLSGKEDFFHLEMEELANILSSDNLMASSELDIYNLARCWWEYRSKDNKPLPRDLLRAIRLQLLNPDELEEVSRDIPKHDPHFKFPTGIRLRQGMFDNKIICMDARALDETQAKEEDYYLTVYDPKMDSWGKLPFCGFLQQAGIASIGSCLYVSGGFRQERNVSNTLYVYDALLNEWKELPSMTHPRAYHGLQAYKNKLYSFGGCNKRGLTDSVECFSVFENRWRNVSSMPLGLFCFISTMMKEKLFVIGGMTRTNNRIKRYQGFHIYNILTDTWSQFPLPVVFSAAGAVTVGERIYVIANYKSRQDDYSANPSYDTYPPYDQYAAYLLYNQQPNTISKSFCMDELGRICYGTIPPILESISGAAVVRWNHRIYIVGGSDYEGMSHDQVFYWSPGEPRWTICSKEIPFPNDDFQSVTLKFPMKRFYSIIPGRRSDKILSDC